MALLPLLLSLCSACGAISFDVSQALPEEEIPGSLLGGLLPSFVPVPIPLTINLQEETQKQGTGPATSAYLKSLTLSATPPSMPSGNFDFLDQVQISIGPSGQGSSLPTVQIANIPSVPMGQTTLQFNVVPGVDLLPYINAGAQLTGTATGTQPRMDFSYDGQVVVTIKI